MELSALSLRLRALSVLRGLLSHPLVRAYGDTLTALDGTAADFADRYGALCATRFSCGDIAQAVLDAVHFDTNTLTDTINAPEAAVLNAATHDLDVLNALLALDGEAFKSAAADKFYEPALEDLPDFEAADSLPFSTGAALADYYREEGYGFFAQSSAFAMQDDGSATPIVHPDAIRLHGPATASKTRFAQSCSTATKGHRQVRPSRPNEVPTATTGISPTSPSCSSRHSVRRSVSSCSST